MRRLRHLPLPRGLQNPHAEVARGLRAESWVRTCSLRSLLQDCKSCMMPAGLQRNSRGSVTLCWLCWLSVGCALGASASGASGWLAGWLAGWFACSVLVVLAVLVVLWAHRPRAPLVRLLVGVLAGLLAFARALRHGPNSAPCSPLPLPETDGGTRWDGGHWPQNMLPSRISKPPFATPPSLCYAWPVSSHRCT